jgi:hypothetical protein
VFDNNKDLLTIVKRQEESHGKMLLEMGRVGNALVNIEKLLSKNFDSYTAENIVLQTYTNTFAANGYLYNSLFVGDAAIADNAQIIIDGIVPSYTIVLVAGENCINIPDGATFRVTTTSGNPVTALLSRYNTPGNNDTNVSILGTPNVNANVTGSTIRQPVDIQSHMDNTIQTHNAVSIPLNSSSTPTTWQSSDGYQFIGISVMNDVNTTSISATVVWSYDGATIQGADLVIGNKVTNAWGNTISGITQVKAPFFKLIISNLDGAAAHTMSAWAFPQA